MLQNIRRRELLYLLLLGTQLHVQRQGFVRRGQEGLHLQVIFVSESLFMIIEIQWNFDMRSILVGLISEINSLKKFTLLKIHCTQRTRRGREGGKITFPWKLNTQDQSFPWYTTTVWLDAPLPPSPPRFPPTERGETRPWRGKMMSLLDFFPFNATCFLSLRNGRRRGFSDTADHFFSLVPFSFRGTKKRFLCLRVFFFLSFFLLWGVRPPNRWGFFSLSVPCDLLLFRTSCPRASWSTRSREVAIVTVLFLCFFVLL